MVSTGSVYLDQMKKIADRLHDEWQKSTRFKQILKGCQFWDEEALHRSVDVAKAVENFQSVYNYNMSNKTRMQFEKMVGKILEGIGGNLDAANIPAGDAASIARWIVSAQSRTPGNP